MSDTAVKLVKRHQRVAFMDTDTTGKTPKFERMTGFTSLTNEYTGARTDCQSA